jgi:hypothetical protein
MKSGWVERILSLPLDLSLCSSSAGIETLTNEKDKEKEERRADL